MEMLFEQRRHSLLHQPKLETGHPSNEAFYVSVRTQETLPSLVVRGMICATYSVVYRLCISQYREQITKMPG